MSVYNPTKWLEDFYEASKRKDSQKLYDLRVEIFTDTKELSRNGGYFIDKNSVKLEEPPVSKVYDKEIQISSADTKKGKGPAKISVVNEDCLSVARKYADKKPLVLNMANRQTPGGGVEYGAGAQEECLFRSSNYFLTLYEVEKYYPMDRNFGGIYSADVTVFRGLEEDGYPLLKEPFKVNFVAVAALNRPPLTASGELTAEMKTATENKIKTIFNIAILNGQKILILSAFGCGAFKNPPRDVANIFKDILKKRPYRDYFEEVIFAIKPNHRDVENLNFKTFEDVFRK